MSDAQAFVGLDVGGTRMKVLAFDRQARTLAEESITTEDDGTRVWMDRASGVMRRVMDRVPRPARIGVAAPGLPAADGRSIAVMPGRLAGLEGLNWQRWL